MYLKVTNTGSLLTLQTSSLMSLPVDAIFVELPIQ